jgi:hypothetical protein
VAGDGHDLRIDVVQVGEVVADGAQLGLTVPGERERDEDDQ